MKKLPLFLLFFSASWLRSEEIALPAKLPAYEAFIVSKLTSGIANPKEKAMIHVIVAAGDGEDVQRHEEMEIPQGSTAVDAAVQWAKKYRTPLLGWAQGLVVIRRKTGDTIERISWTMRKARTEAPKFQMQNGDVLIGLVYGDF